MSHQTDGTETVQRCGSQITSVMEVLHTAAQAKTADQECSHRLLLASGFLCLAAWTLSGMGGVKLTDRIVKLHYLLRNIGQDTNPVQFTNPANQAEPSLSVN